MRQNQILKYLPALLLCAALLLAGGCASKYQKGLPPGMVNVAVPPPLVPQVTKLEDQGERNWVLNLNELATMAMRLGAADPARRALDESTLLINAIFGGGADARAARSLFFSEDVKIFKGDPYERSMAFFYRGVLYMQEGDWQNARAMFRSAILQDAFAEEEQNRADWVMFDYLIAVCEAQLGREFYAKQAYERAMTEYDEMLGKYPQISGQRFPTDDLRPPLPKREDNFLLIVQTGTGPQKIRVGQYGEFAAFHRQANAIPVVRVSVDESMVVAVMTDSVFYQSTTRGGREFDRVQGRKVLFKAATGAVGEAALWTGALILADADHNDQAMAGAAVMAAGLLITVVSELTRPNADIRHWHDLPDALGVTSGSLSPGAHGLVVNTGGFTVDTKFTVPPPGQGMTVILAFDGPNPALLVPRETLPGG